jgi:hypothetical protein
MFRIPGKTAWRLLAAVPFVLLLGIVGIKVTAGDPSSPFNKIPGAQTIQELGDDAPSTNVTVKLPKTAKPTPSASSSSASASASSAALTPTPTTAKPGPTKQDSSGSGGSADDGPTGAGGSAPKPDPTTSAPDPTPTETRSAAQITCESNGGHWRYVLGRWTCSIL